MPAPHAKEKAARRVLLPDDEWAERINARLRADCHPWQRDGYDDPADLIAFLVGRGGAKTTTMRARALRKVTRIKRGLVVYIATSRPQAEELMWNKLKETAEAYGLTSSGDNPDLDFLDSRLRMTCLRTGATYRLFGVEDKRDAEKLRGQPFDEVQIDECGSFDPVLLEYLIDQCILPRLGERNGSLVLGSTPPPTLEGLFYEVTREGSDQHRRYSDRDRPEFRGWKNWSSHSWTLKDVVDLPDADKYPALVANWKKALEQKERKGWSDDNPIWRREYLGEWSADNTSTVFRYRPHVDGQAWNQWDPFGEHPLEGPAMLKAAIDALPLGPNGQKLVWSFVYSGDTGTRDPFALNIFAFCPSDPGRRVFHVFSFERVGVLYARLLAQMLFGADDAAPNGCCPHDRPKGLIGITGWPVGSVLDGDAAYIEELANSYSFRFKKAEKNPNYKFGAIELVNGDLVEGFIKILKGSPLEKQLGTLQWRPDDFGNPRENKRQANHSTDTLIYARRLIAHLFESGLVENEAPRPAYVDPMGLGTPDREERDEFDDKMADPTYGDDAWGGI